jgi:hypothetical protein
LKKVVKTVGLDDVDNANLSLCKYQIYVFGNDEGSYVSEKWHVFLSNGVTINFSGWILFRSSLQLRFQMRVK